MKNLITGGIFFLTLIFAQFTTAQTVDDVIGKHIEALGGKEKLLSLKSMKMVSSINMQGYDVVTTTTRLNNIGSRNDMEIEGTSNYQIATPTKGILFMPFRGMSSPTDMPEEQLKAGQNGLDIQSPFLNYKEKGNTIELLGTEKVDGEDNYKLKLTFKNGLVTTYFIGVKNNLINKTSAKSITNGVETDMEFTCSNYKQNKDGYWFAYTISSIQGVREINSVETNQKVDESIFR